MAGESEWYVEESESNERHSLLLNNVVHMLHVNHDHQVLKVWVVLMEVRARTMI